MLRSLRTVSPQVYLYQHTHTHTIIKAEGTEFTLNVSLCDSQIYVNCVNVHGSYIGKKKNQNEIMIRFMSNIITLYLSRSPAVGQIGWFCGLDLDRRPPVDDNWF